MTAPVVPAAARPPLLPGFPAAPADPSVAEWAVIDAALVRAEQQLTAFLAAPGAVPYIERVFGVAQRAKAVETYRKMLVVVGKWRARTLPVKVSGWLDRNVRKGETDGTTGRLTLPTAALAANPAAAVLGVTVLHESAHGVGKEIIDLVYVGTEGFKAMLGTDRLLNAPHFDFTVTEWIAGAAVANLAVGNANAAAKGHSAQQAPTVGGQFLRTQSIVTHARVHAENWLARLVAEVRLGQSPDGILDACDGMLAPGRTGPVTVADVTHADAFVTAVRALYAHVTALGYEVQVGPPLACAVVAAKLQVHFPDTTSSFTPVPIAGDLTVDPWVDRMMTAILTHHVVGGGVTADTLARVDRQYHLSRGLAPH